jgi:hypothetical protein
VTDWIEHDGGPQPVAGDVWVEVSQLYQADDRDLARWIAWDYKLRYRILNQHLIDAARLEGIRLGLEAAALDVLQTGRLLRPSMGETAEAIRLLDPATIAKEADQ